MLQPSTCNLRKPAKKGTRPPANTLIGSRTADKTPAFLQMKNLRQAAGLLEALLSQQLLRSCCPTYPGPCCALRCGLSLSRHQRVVRLCSLSAVMSPSSSTAAQDWGRVGVL